MSKKIVVITGSPRKKGNSFAMTEAFIQAAEAKGPTVYPLFDCRAKKCWAAVALRNTALTAESLLFDDDFNTICSRCLLEAARSSFLHAFYWIIPPRKIRASSPTCFHPFVVGARFICGQGVCCDCLL